MTADTLPPRPPPPPLESPRPRCSVCGAATSWDGDAWYCAPCGAHWWALDGYGTGRAGLWAPPDAPACGAEYVDGLGADRIDYAQGGTFPRWVWRCVLTVGHPGPHRGPRADDAHRPPWVTRSWTQDPPHPTATHRKDRA